MHTSHFQSPWREHHTEPFPSFAQQPVQSFCCKLDSWLPSKSLQLTDIVIFWTCLSHFQNGMLSHPLQSIVKLSSCSCFRFTNAFPLTNDIVLFIRYLKYSFTLEISIRIYTPALSKPLHWVLLEEH